MAQPKVSVIVPVYNVEEYLARCLDSLLAQTLEEIEIIVVNDGSPDNSQEIIDRYAAAHPDKIRAFLKENGGLSDARNFGVERATGEYIGFVDSDDHVDFDMYEKMYQKAVDTGAQVVCCPISNEYANRTVKTFYNEVFFGLSVKQSPKIMAYANSLAHNKIYQRAFWQENHFMFPLRQWFEDSYLIYNVMLTANKVECVNIPFVHYWRDREGSITNQFDMRLFDILKSAESIISYFKAYGVFEDINEEIEYICLRHLNARLFNMRKCPDHAVARRFVREMVALLDREFPNWRHNRYVNPKKNASLRGRISKLLLRSEMLMKMYVSAPDWLYAAFRSCMKAQKKLRPKNKAREQKKAEKNLETKRYYIQKNGMAVLHEVQQLLADLGVTSFADFGTCLGLVREGQLLKHDLDMDIGVIAKPEDREKIRIALERRGFKLWRQYRYNGDPVEESYHYRRVKVDLNFYEMTDDYARTWLFYTKPDHEYENSWTRHVVQMTYSPIRGVKHQEFGGYLIALPENPELLLSEKYGPNWRTPDTGWIYWQSPAAVKMEEIGSFKLFRYTGSVYVDQEAAYLEKNKKQLEIIRRLQEQEFVVLEEFDRVCKQLGLAYYLGEGTLLGAIRHAGFVPWDQNLTVWMERSRYDRLLKEAPALLGERFELQHRSLTDNYYVPCIKIRLLDKNLFVDESIAHLTENNGPCIEILPLDSVPRRFSKKLIRQRKWYTVYQNALYFKQKQKVANSRKKKLIRFFSHFVTKKQLSRCITRICTKYNSPENHYYVCLPSKHGIRKETFEKSLFDTPRYALFEGKEFPVPHKAEVILQRVYNNYVRPTPPYKRNLRSPFVYVPEEYVEPDFLEDNEELI